MQIGAAFAAGAEPFELVQPAECALDHPADLAQSGAVGDFPSDDHGFDATFPQRTAVLVEVVAPVGVRTPRLAARAPLSSSNRRDRVERGQELGDVVSVAAGERDGEWGAMAVDDQVVLGAGTGAADGRGPNVVPRSECSDVRSVHRAVTQVKQVGAAKLGQQGGVQAWPDIGLGPLPQPVLQAATQEQLTASAGTSRQATPVRSTNRTQASAARSGARNTTRDAGRVVRERAAATGPPAPTGRPNQDQHAPGCLADQDRRVQDRRHLIAM